jgi:phosphoenolpyruvate carboxykinase (ATP)
VQVPEAGPEVFTALLRPRQTWHDPAAYDAQARQLAAQFAANFAKFAGHVGEEVRQAGPRLA